MNLAEAIPRIAQEEGIPAEYLDAKVRIESGYNQAARSRSGAIGYGQLMPATARGLGVDPTDPESNLRGAARYLNQMYKQFGDWDLAVAAYNAGPNAVLRHGGIPPYEETRNHVRKFNEALAAPSPVLGGASAAPAGGGFSPMAPVAGSAGALQQLAQSILEGNLDGASRPTASGLEAVAQAGLVDPFAPRRMAASGDFFEAMAGLSGGLTEPVAAAVRSVIGGGAPANNIRPLDVSASAMASSGDLIDAGRVIDFRRDPLPSTGDHLDVRVVGPDGKYRNPANEQALLSRLLVGENPLYVDGRSSFLLTSGFGPRKPPRPGASSFHPGTDYAVPAGTPLRWRGGGRFTRQNGYGLVETMHNGEPFQIKLLHTTG